MNMTDINDQMIIESNDIVGYSDYYTYTDFSENENLDSVINSIGSYICSDIDNEEPFLKNLLNKYDTNLDNLFNNTTIQSIKELSDNFVEKDNYIKKKAEEIENNFNIFTNISSDIDKIKNIFRVNLENMVHIEKELKELIDKYKKNKKVILDVRNTYKDEDNETLKQFEEIFDKIRRQAESCDSLQSFFIHHSLGGGMFFSRLSIYVATSIIVSGTGSGLGTYLLRRLRDEMPKICRFCVSVFPSEDDDVITSPYVCVC